MKKNVKKSRKLVRIILMLTFIGVAAASIVMFFADDTYRSERQFNEYVSDYFSEADIQRIHEEGKEAEVLSYGEPLSLAMRIPILKHEKSNGYIEEKVASIDADFRETYKKADNDDRYLRLVNYDTYNSGREAVSVVLFQEDRKKIDHEMLAVDKHVYTAMFSTKTGRQISGINIFNDGYKKFFSQYLTKHYESNYSEELVDGYAEYLADTPETLNDYVLTKTGVKFFFQPGTILPEEKGIIAVEVGYFEMEGLLRDKIDLYAVDPSRPMVAITYDDGPMPETSNRIIDVYEKYGVVATFFELGANVSKYPEITKRKAELGMQIGSHTWNHPNLNTINEAQIQEQITSTNNALIAATGAQAAVFRPPYGNSNEVVWRNVNVPLILWSVDTLDWQSRDAKAIMNIVTAIEEKEGLDGRVILMHSIYESTAEATEIMVPWLIDKGYQLVTVTDMIKYRYNEEPQPGKLYGYGYFYTDKNE